MNFAAIMPRAAALCLGVISTLPAPVAAEAPASRAAVFESSTLLPGVSVAAPFSDLFKRTRGALVPGEKPELPTVRGTLRLVDQDGHAEVFENVKVSARGGTSLQPDQCTFPKLTLKFETSTKGTSLGGLKTIKIGTHCGERPTPLPPLGRIGNESAPIREALVYAALRRVGVVSLLARPAEVTYRDTSKKVDNRVFPANPLTRKAFFLEDDGESAKRYGGKIVQKAQNFPSLGPLVFRDAASSRVEAVQVALLLLGQALVDNDDWYVKLWVTDAPKRLFEAYTNWNVNIIGSKGGPTLLQMYDFDLCGWVRGTHSAPEPRFTGALARARAYPGMTPAALQVAIGAYVEAKADIRAQVNALFMTPGVREDAAGQTNILIYLDEFFAFLERQATT